MLISSFARSKKLSSVIAIHCWMPALLIKTFRSGCSFSIQLYNSSLSSTMVRSQALVMIEGSLSFASFRADSRLPQMITVLFSRTNRSASAKPIPVAPPVMRVLLLERFMLLSFFFKNKFAKHVGRAVLGVINNSDSGKRFLGGKNSYDNQSGITENPVEV